MTLAFEKFMQQHRETGSAKADGYSDDVFIGLEKDERNVVFDLLVKELPWAAEWLVLVDREKALKILMQKEKELRGNGYEHTYMIQQQIVKCTGDIEYQKHMIEDYSIYISRIKPLVIDSIGRTPINQDVINFLKKVILVEIDASAVARASRNLLTAVRFPNDSDAETGLFRKVENELRSDDDKIKQRALAKVSKREKLFVPSVQAGVV